MLDVWYRFLPSGISKQARYSASDTLHFTILPQFPKSNSIIKIYYNSLKLKEGLNSECNTTGR